MKFTVRDGFVVNFVERSEAIVEGAKKTVEREYSHYPGDAAFELTDKQAREHAHKLEPAAKDKDAAAFLESLVRDPADSVQSAGEPVVALSKVQELVDAAVAKALAASKPAA